MAGFEAFPNKRLCDVVFPGTHDAGIYGTSLGGTARTQTLSLGEQAAAGVRYFDLRIATIKTSAGLEQRAYHAPKLAKKTSSAGDYQKPHLFAGVSALTGIGADRLSTMLDQARAFVISNPHEFLILRFSKCGDMEDVVNQCLLKLGAERFDQNVNLNVALLTSLAGKVITVFDKEDFDKFPVALKNTPGILPVKALFGAGTTSKHASYEPNRWGLQYFGKYSNTPNSSKNVNKQMEILAQGPKSAPELLGMMYWTLTTNIATLANPFASIKNRDKKMWNAGQQALTSAWKAGVKDHIIARAGHQHRQWLAKGYPPAGVGREAKSFMPNIIMMDFAAPDRCATIWNLNLTTDEMMTRMGDDITNVGALL